MSHASYPAFLLAGLPVAWLLLALGIFRLRLAVAAPIALGLAAGLGVWAFGADPALVGWSAIQGASFGLWPISWIVLAAFFAYRVSIQSGALAQIRQVLSALALPPAAAGLLVAFCFGSFLEGAAGFGTPLVVPIGILIGLGFSPMQAGEACLVANTVPVAWAGLGIPIFALAQAARLDAALLARAVALQMIIPSLVTPVAIAWLIRRHNGAAAAPGTGRRDYAVAFLTGVVFAMAQALTACLAGPELPAVTAGIASGAACLGAFTLDSAEPGKKRPAVNIAATVKAWSPYLILLVLVVATRLWDALRGILTSRWFILTVRLPRVEPMRFDVAYNPGTQLILAALLGGALMGVGKKVLTRAWLDACSKVLPVAVTIACLAAMSKVMSYAGMTGGLAWGITGVSGRFYPFLAPFLGALGTFLTGTDTAANMLFGAVQADIAARLRLAPAWLAGANAAGGAIGKLISPQSLATAVLAMGGTGGEDALLKRSVKWCLAFGLVLALVVGLGA